MYTSAFSRILFTFFLNRFMYNTVQVYWAIYNNRLTGCHQTTSCFPIGPSLVLIQFPLTDGGWSRVPLPHYEDQSPAGEGSPSVSRFCCSLGPRLWTIVSCGQIVKKWAPQSPTERNYGSEYFANASRMRSNVLTVQIQVVQRIIKLTWYNLSIVLIDGLYYI